RATLALESHPWVVSARVERRFPSTILATVLEHRPAALVQLGGLYVLDEQGRLFKRAAPDDGLDLPLITGLTRDEWQRPESQVRLWSALHFLDAWRGEGLPVAALSELRIDDGLTAFARDGDSVQEIRVGTGSVSEKIRKLSQVRAALARRGEHAARIDLDNQ